MTPASSTSRNVKSLREVDLSMTDITDAALTYLDQLPALEHLDISVTLVSTAASAQGVSASPPELEVEARHERTPTWLTGGGNDVGLD